MYSHTKPNFHAYKCMRIGWHIDPRRERAGGNAVAHFAEPVGVLTRKKNMFDSPYMHIN